MTSPNFPIHPDTPPTQREAAAIRFLDANHLDYELVQHPAVYTCEQALELLPDFAGTPTKHLFLRNRKGTRYYLVMVKPEHRVSLKALSSVLDAPGLTMASSEALADLLGLEPGAVCFLGLLNDVDQQVHVIFDRELWDAPSITSHPLVNTASVILGHAAVVEILDHTGHDVRVLEVP